MALEIKFCVENEADLRRYVWWGTIRTLRMSLDCDQVAIRDDSSDTSRSAITVRL